MTYRLPIVHAHLCGTNHKVLTMEKQVPDNRPTHQAACHCGTVRFTVKLTDDLRTARRCNCSPCRLRGAVAASANLNGLAVLQGADALTLYQFNTGVAKHYFCAKCGIYPFHQRRSSPHEYGINVACIEGMSPFDFEEVPVNEGQTHPKDRPSGGSVIAGWVRYESNADTSSRTSACRRTAKKNSDTASRSAASPGRAERPA